MKTSLKQLNLEQISTLIKQANQASFRTKQLLEWLYKHNIRNLNQASNLPASLLSYIDENYMLDSLSLCEKQSSSDGTCKYLFALSDNNCVEAVAIPSLNNSRLTVCFSTQVGCAMACKFCATGTQGFARNLGMGEILDQISFIAQEKNQRISNLVAMGQGEPFLNFQNTLDALLICNNPSFYNIAARKITISTCGIPSGIDKLSTYPQQFTLAVSLHAAIQKTRDYLMPAIANNTLEQLKKHLVAYSNATNRRVTFEYLLIKNVNDNTEHLEALIEYCSSLLCHVNLLPLNATNSSDFFPSTNSTVREWEQSLKEAGIPVSFRSSHGADIDGACGQLKNSHISNLN